MAQLLWGNVYFHQQYAGVLQQEPGDRISFSYDPVYLKQGGAAIAHTLPLRSEPYISETGLPAFFDNLVAEGWLEQAQMRLLGKRITSRFELLLAFGYDCAGAVSIIDPEPAKLSDKLMDIHNSKDMALLTSRASLSGVQPKLAIIERQGKYYPTQLNELSTHIAKFSSPGHKQLLDNEYLTTLALTALLPDDNFVKIFIGSVEGQSEPALIIKRFDREANGRLHFEEFNQLLGYPSIDKYNGSYKDMADFIYKTPGCLPTENYRLFGRVLAGLIFGNTDMHFKNFAMLHTPQGLRLTPAYDEVAASLYAYKTIALSLAGITDLQLTELKPKHIIALAKEFGLSSAATHMMITQLENRKDAAKQAIADADIQAPLLKDKLISLMEKRWNATFALIGSLLLKRP